MCIKSEFKGIFSIPATNDQNDKAFFVDIKILTPGVCLPLPGAIYMWKNMKKHIEIVLKLATNGQSDKGFC